MDILAMKFEIDPNYANPKYFRMREDNRCTPTAFFEYKLAKQAESYFKSRIIEMDTEGKYVKWSERSKKDEDASKALSGKYTERLNRLDDMMKKYQSNHPDEYEVVHITDSDMHSDEYGQFKGMNFIPEQSYSLEDCWHLYVVAKHIIKKYEGEAKSDLPTTTKTQSKAEFKARHKQLKDMYRTQLGIPPQEELTVKTVQLSPTMATVRAGTDEGNGDLLMEDLAKDFEKYLEEEWR